MILRVVIRLSLVVFLSSCDGISTQEQLPDTPFQLNVYLKDAIAGLGAGLEAQLSIDRLIKLGTLLEQSRWPEYAADWATAANQYSYQNAHLSTLLGQYHLAAGDLLTAQEYASRANRLGWQSVEFYQLQAEISTQRKAYPQAIDYVNRAILINQSDYYLYQTKADIYLTLGDTVSGINFLEKGLSLQPRLRDISDRLIGLYLLGRKNDAAIDLIREVQRYYPEDPKLVLQEVDYFLSENRIDVAKSRLIEKIGNSQEDNIPLKTSLADIYQNLGLADSSLLISSQLLGIDSTLIGEHVRQGQLYDQKNFLSRSLDSYNRALQLDPGSALASSGRLKVLRKLAYLRELREAKEQLDQFQSLTPKKNQYE